MNVNTEILKEDPFYFSEGRKRGVDAGKSTLRDWATKGLKSRFDRTGEIVKLEVARRPGGLCTSLAAIDRFHAKLNESR